MMYHRRAFKRQCTEDGTWQSGECVAVTCDPPPPIFHGTYKCTNGFQFNSDCWIDCNRANHTVRQHSHCKQVCRVLSLLLVFSFLPSTSQSITSHYCLRHFPFIMRTLSITFKHCNISVLSLWLFISSMTSRLTDLTCALFHSSVSQLLILGQTEP